MSRMVIRGGMVLANRERRVDVAVEGTELPSRDTLT